MFKMIGLALLIAVVALLAFAATKPDSFRIERTASINAPPEKIFPLINNFHHWESWSPWEKLDPTMTRTYSGATEGTGAAYAWEGKGDVGAGKMEITAAVPSTKVAIQLDFIKPFKAANEVELTLEPEGDTTNVTWAMSGANSFMFKVMQVFTSMDSMVGKDFEKGLANLKAVAEK